MFRLYGFFTQNSMKAMYVLEALDEEFEFVFVNLMKGEHKSAEFQRKTPVGKAPVLEHNGEFLFESGAICRYVANVSDSPLYPKDAMERARVDQWMDFFSCHLGRWLSKLYFEEVIKQKARLGERDDAGIEEATKYAHEQFAILNSQLAESEWLANDTLSIADLFAFAYVEQYRSVDFPLHDFANVQAWFDRIDASDSVARARARLPA